jgi:hypothetical protein
MTKFPSIYLFIAWLIALVILFVPPPNDPPSTPSGVGLARGYPVHYASPAPIGAVGALAFPAPLSAYVGQHYDGDAPPWPASGDIGSWPDTGASYADDEAVPLTYEERFSPEAIGPDWAWAEAACEGCPIAIGAVKEQGVGE